jgi:hypothetical protein
MQWVVPVFRASKLDILMRTAQRRYSPSLPLGHLLTGLTPIGIALGVVATGLGILSVGLTMMFGGNRIDFAVGSTNLLLPFLVSGGLVLLGFAPVALVAGQRLPLE